jgi:hypothetical protein
MRNLFITTAIATVFAGAAFAEDTMAPAGPILSGEISMDIAETAAGNWGATTGLELGIAAPGIAHGSIDFVATPGGDLAIDGWSMGTSVASVGLSIGDQGGVFVEGENGATLAAPSIKESLQVSVAGAEVALGFGDLASDVTDIENIQGAYTLALGDMDVTTSGDYNLNTKDYALGARVSGLEVAGIGMGSTITYADSIAFEVDANVMGITAYFNGDQDELAQNIGGSYTYNLMGMDVEGGLNYNIDSSEFTPTVGLSFTF